MPLDGNNPASVTMQASEDLLKLTKELRETMQGTLKSHSERLEQAERMTAQLQREVKASRRSAIFPEFDPRLIAFDASQKGFERMIESRPVGGSELSRFMVQDLQAKNDDLYLKSVLLRAMKDIGHQVPDLRATKSWQEFQRTSEELRKAMDTETSGYGSEWVPTGFSQMLKEKIILQLKVAALFETFQMPTNPYKWPFAAARPVATRVTEGTASANPYDQLTDANRAFNGLSPTSNTTFDAVKLRALEIYSREFEEDTVTAALPWLMGQMAQAIAEGWEDAILNGDTDASTHIDSDITEPPTGVTPKTLVDGLRKYAKETAANTTALTTLSTANLRTMRSSMGVYGVNPADLAWITSINGYISLLGLTEVVTMDKYGPSATVLSGELGKFDGIPIIISEFMRTDLNTAGVHDGVTTNNTGVLLVHRPRWMVGKRPGLGVETERLKATDQGLIVVFDRGDFKQVNSSTAKSVAYGIDLAN